MSTKKISSIKEFKIQYAIGSLETISDENLKQMIDRLNIIGRIKFALWGLSMRSRCKEFGRLHLTALKEVLLFILKGKLHGFE